MFCPVGGPTLASVTWLRYVSPGQCIVRNRMRLSFQCCVHMVDCSLQCPIETEVVKPLHSAVPWLVLKTKTSSICLANRELIIMNVAQFGGYC